MNSLIENREILDVATDLSGIFLPLCSELLRLMLDFVIYSDFLRPVFFLLGLIEMSVIPTAIIFWLNFKKHLWVGFI